MHELRQNDSTIPYLIMDAHAHDGYISDEYSVVNGQVLSSLLLKLAKGMLLS